MVIFALEDIINNISFCERTVLEKERILLVESNQKLIIYIKNLLDKRFDITPAINCDQVIYEVKNTNYDIVLFDILFPGSECDCGGLMKRISDIQPEATIIVLPPDEIKRALKSFNENYEEIKYISDKL